MKKLLFLIVAVALGIGTMFANPVDVKTAKSLGQMFVQANFEQMRNADLELVHTVMSDNGEPCVYVFNVGNHGFVMIAASDNVRPVLAYSEEGPFDASNPHNGAMFMLYTYKNSISYALENDVKATPDVVGEWRSLANCGKLNNNKGTRVNPLVKTKWNQDSPYNYYAPAASGGPGGRCYAGCVATAMSQLMKVWDKPLQGQGTFSYYCYPYGTLTANFGATTYDWENMPISLGSNQTQIEAVAKLMYHCGVSVRMGFSPSGSGSNSERVPSAMSSFFDYDYCSLRYRSNYSLANWISMLKNEFNLCRPVYYSGNDAEGGHAFVCDGYDENDLMHYNFGWSGTDDGWYAVDAMQYHNGADAIFNFVPTAVYNYTMQAPANVTATKTNDLAQEATITWTNPTTTTTNQNVSTLDRVVVKRNGKIIYTQDNVTPGATMSCVDSDVPCYSTFEYQVYAVYNDINGLVGTAKESFGPTCTWQIEAEASSTQGWGGGRIVAYDGAGRVIDSVTMTSGGSQVLTMDLTLGKVSLAWAAGSQSTSVGFNIINSVNETVYSFPEEGGTAIMTAGVFFEGNNGCGNPAPTEEPSELFAVNDGANIILTWVNDLKSNYGYNIYRDGLLCELSHTNEFIDEAPSIGGHCYQICILGEGGESVYSNEACATAGEGCESGSNLWFTLQNNGKPTITWELPENAQGLSGFFLYGKKNNEEYTLVETLGPTKVKYKEVRPLAYGNWYYYKIIPYYGSINCYSAPIKSKYGNEYFVKIFYYSPEGVDEYETQDIEVYPNPAKDVLTVKAENLNSVAMYNLIGQKVFAQDFDTDEVTINTSDFDSGIYIIRIVANDEEITRKISVIK